MFSPNLSYIVSEYSYPSLILWISQTCLFEYLLSLSYYPLMKLWLAICHSIPFHVFHLFVSLCHMLGNHFRISSNLPVFFPPVSIVSFNLSTDFLISTFTFFISRSFIWQIGHFLVNYFLLTFFKPSFIFLSILILHSVSIIPIFEILVNMTLLYFADAFLFPYMFCKCVCVCVKHYRWESFETWVKDAFFKRVFVFLTARYSGIPPAGPYLNKNLTLRVFHSLQVMWILTLNLCEVRLWLSIFRQTYFPPSILG